MDTAQKLMAAMESKRVALAALETKRRDLVERLLDAPDSKRAALVQERATLAAEGLALQDEIAELLRRYRAAAIAPFEQAEAAAIVAVTEAQARATSARLTVNGAIDEQRRWLATGRGGLDRAAGDRAEAEWIGKIALLRAEGQIAGDATRHAARVRDDAHASTEAERERLAALKV